MKEPFSSLPEESKRNLERTKMPDWIAPMLATLTDERFSSPDWIYERKLEGEIVVFDGRLRHPRYIGLRHDKPARKVRRERPKNV